MFFIPDNVSEDQTELALRFLRFATSRAGQQIVADVEAVPTCNYELTTSEILKKIIDLKQSCVMYINPCRYSSSMQDFIKQEIFTTTCLDIRLSLIHI